MSQRRTILLTIAALGGFAANSLLCRAALAGRTVDAASFTLIRLASGAMVLSLLCRQGPRPRQRQGSWAGATALFTYAITFSYAYLRLDAGIGALILFGVVQLTMWLGAMRARERIGGSQWLGLAIAFGGLLFLTGIVQGSRWQTAAPPPPGAAAMAVAGVAWGIYSLLGRGCPNPLAATADNFVRSVPFAVAASLVAIPTFDVSVRGILLAAASGGVASGLGYSLWYAALRNLTATRAAISQLAVPVLTAVGSILLLGEPLTTTTAGAGMAILAGVAIALRRR